MAESQLVTVLPGARRFNEGNVNPTFRGQILLNNGDVKGAILKDLDHVQLANELLASALARVLGLPTPDAHLALVRNGDLAASLVPTADGNHLVFASVDVRVPNVTFQMNSGTAATNAIMFKELLSWARLGQLYAFDSWVANIDRHPGNLLFGGPDAVWLIDHGHCFTGPAWTPPSLDPVADYPNRLAEWVSGRLTETEKRTRSAEASAFSANIIGVDVNNCADGSLIRRLIPPDFAAAVEEFLVQRTPRVPSEVSKALGTPVLV